MRRLFALSMLFAFFAGLFFVAPNTASAAHGHYPSGVEGLKVASLPPNPGWYYRFYLVNYSASSMRDNNGHEIHKDFDLSLNVMGHRLTYRSEIESLGGNLFSNIIFPFSYIDYHGPGNSYTDHTFDIGDAPFDPIGIAWNEDRFDAVLAATVFLPMGDFDVNNPTKLSKGYWSFMLSGGGTIYFDEEKEWHLSALARYEINLKQRETDINPGEDFSFEWGLGKTFRTKRANIDVGVIGYCSWQLNEDSGGNDRYSPNTNLYRAFAIGPEIAVEIPEWKAAFALRTTFELGNRNAAQGSLTAFTFTKAF